MPEKPRTALKIVFLGIPLLVTIIGGTLIYQTDGGFWTSTGDSSVSVASIYMGTALVMVLASLFYRIFNNRWYWACTIALILIYSYLLLKTQEEGNFFRLILPVAIYCTFVTIITINVFYNLSLIRIRTLLFALSGAVAFTVSMAIFYFLFGLGQEPSFLINRFVNGLYLFIFLGVGMSLADMAIYKVEVKELRHQTSENGNDEDCD